MKTYLRLLPSQLLLGLLLTAVSCSKDKTLPYYQFTAEDRKWLTAKNGDVWAFENAQGKRMRFQLHNVREEKATVTEPGTFKMEDQYHHDRYSVAMFRLDTVLSNLSHFEFKRDLPTGTTYKNAPKDNGQFHIKAHWDGYIGNPSRERPGELNLPAVEEMSSRFQQLTVRNRRYENVLEVTSDGQCSTCFIPGGIPFHKLYYDQRYGVVRLIERNGDVWDRLP
ncbi:hypothetical protein [Hymenobacter koreensis]|uniref:Lipoprotein n=1 Tax=Hymenobacter koreensis TaxID=1084523 RepID=A0ABP8IYP6_9BACT